MIEPQRRSFAREKTTKNREGEQRRLTEHAADENEKIDWLKCDSIRDDLLCIVVFISINPALIYESKYCNA